MKILIPNIGSTSFKYRLLEVPGEKVLAEGRVERIRPAGRRVRRLPGSHPQVHVLDLRRGKTACGS
jgi:acetate kinase